MPMHRANKGRSMANVWKRMLKEKRRNKAARIARRITRQKG